jgi:hypothetical protein
MGLGRHEAAKVLLCHTKILVFQLLDPPLQSSILISQLYQLCIHFIYGRHFWINSLRVPFQPNLGLLIVAFLHDVFDLLRYKCIIILAVRFEDALHQLKSLS